MFVPKSPNTLKPSKNYSLVKQNILCVRFFQNKQVGFETYSLRNFKIIYLLYNNSSSYSSSSSSSSFGVNDKRGNEKRNFLTFF